MLEFSLGTKIHSGEINQMGRQTHVKNPLTLRTTTTRTLTFWSPFTTSISQLHSLRVHYTIYITIISTLTISTFISHLQLIQFDLLFIQATQAHIMAFMRFLLLFALLLGSSAILFVEGRVARKDLCNNPSVIYI